MKKKRIVACTSAIVFGTSVSAFAALPEPIQRVLNSVAQSFEQRLEAYADVGISKTLGALGIPDPRAIEETLDQEAEKKEGNSTLTSRNDKKIYGQENGRAIADQALGEEAQKDQAEDLQTVSSAVSSIGQAAQTGKKAPVTQRKLDAVLDQNSRQAEISSRIQKSTQETNRQLGAANKNLSDISETLTTDQIAGQQELEAAANSVANKASFYNSLWEKDLL